MKKVLFITEYLDSPYDEGIKKTVYNLFKLLNEKFDTYTISRVTFEHPQVDLLKSNKLFIDRKLKKQITEINPKVIIYFPFQSGTFASYIRQWVLQTTLEKKRVIFFTLQPKSLSKWKKLIVSLIKPKFGITASPEVKKFWDKLKVKAYLVPLPTNLTKFQPLLDEKKKLKLRAKYKLPQGSKIITHIGHLNHGRNLESLIPLNWDDYQVVIVGSSSTPLDALGPDSLKQKLLDSGIIILDGYIENIQDIYHLSDLYIFPVVEKCGSIGMPLSIIEARACGIPVLTTDFGCVKHFLGHDGNSIFYSTPDNFYMKIKEIQLPMIQTKTKVQELNEIFEKTIMDVIENNNA